MDSNDFLLLSLAVTGLALLISLFVGTSDRAVIEENPISGWKKFTIRPAALAGGDNQRTLVSSQESGGITTRSTTQHDQRGTHGSYRDKNSTIVFTSTGKLISEADGKP